MLMEIEEEQRLDDNLYKENDIKKLKEKNPFIYYSSKEIQKKLSEIIKSKIGLNLDYLKYFERGGSSFIYEGTSKDKKKSIVIKVISEERFKNFDEIKIMLRMRHPNIISIYGFYNNKNSELLILMEKGKMDLRGFERMIKRSVLSESFLCYTAFQILEGLNYLYKCNIIHYDIKPNNIVIDDLINIKIIDFSVSMDISEIKDSQIELKYRGTSLYMAPEVINKEKIEIKNFHKIDLFSLGVTLYRLAFGNYPFNLKREDADNDDVIIKKINSDWRVENKGTDFSKHFIDFLNCLLEKDINKRINIFGAMNHYWIQGAKILNEEKENIGNANVFLTSLITDNFINFNKYIL